MAFYLKYRPQKISELDLPQVREGLMGLLKAQELPHALLFSGIRGGGKTSSARIWAKAVNCENRGKDLEPCNECASCIAITKGNSVDVIEMDAASNRKIDDIRELREKVRLAPTSLKYKVYIIDEVHMLTNEAFNALLKTLEEPPAKVLFVLCTTEIDKLPATIVSRCVRVNFRMASVDEIADALARVAKGEKIKIEKGALQLLAKLGEGSFRDATKLLEEVAWIEGEITLAKLQAHFGMDLGERENLINLLNEKNSQGIMNFIETCAQSGADIKLLAGRILDYLHQEWQLSLSGKSSLNYQSRQVGELIDRIDEYWWRFNTAIKAQLPLELALINWIESLDSEKTSDKIEKKQEVMEAPREAQKEARVVVRRDAQPEVKVSQPVVEGNVESVVGRWEEILVGVKEKNISVEAFLRAARPKSWDGDKLVLELAYSFHRDKLLEEIHRRLVEEVIGDLLKAKVRIECVLNPEAKGGRSSQASSTTKYVPSSPPVARESLSNTAYGSGSGRRRAATISSQAPVPSEEDEVLVQFAEELFGK